MTPKFQGIDRLQVRWKNKAVEVIKTLAGEPENKGGSEGKYKQLARNPLDEKPNDFSQKK